MTAETIKNAIRNVPDFPETGIQFKDITPVLADPNLFEAAIDLLIEGIAPGDVDAVVGIDARGFILGAAAALKLKTGFVPVRKKGKLPYKTHEESYELEYGTNTVAIHTDALQPGKRVILMDDLLATGGTALAAVKLLHRLNVDILELAVLVELSFLEARQQFQNLTIRSIVTY
ncbi:MAG TPA: adenine phosphoribosyltransferase [Verrucomicrobiales bacterium]|jgi:adenine phosphoribosyltransferase|nr:adenine phosphoribosyltransferase [Verrucomicrobiales bacterium]